MKSLLTILFIWSGTTLAALAADHPHHESPDLDRRAATEGNRPGQNHAANAPFQGAENTLRQRLPQALVERDALLGSPRWISVREGFLTGPDGEGCAVTRPFRARHQNNDPHRAVKSFVDEYSGMFGHDSGALAAAKTKRDYITAHSGMRTTLWQQETAGIEIFDAIFQAHTTKHGELVNIASHFMPRLAEAIRHPEEFPPAPRISAAQVIGIVCSQGKSAAIPAEEFQPQGTATDAEHRQFFRGKALQGEGRTRLVWLPTDARTLRLGWEVIATPQVSGRMSLSVVDATTGETWIQRDLTSDASDATYRVFIGDSPTPFSPGYATPGNSNQPAAVPRVWTTLKSYDAVASPQGWIPDGGNETLGNNVDAHTDLDDDNTPDLPRPAGSPARTFDFTLDLAQEPEGSTYRKAAVVNLFYWCNWIHDRLYQLGFTEAAGNFQQDNLGRGGEAGDRVQADAQDGGGLNNANFSTPPDGMPPRMQMYIYDNPTPKRDGDFDVQLLIHEYVHGLSRRLVAGGSGPAGPQRKGMSEGWCDFYALALMATANEDPNATYAFGAYVAYGFNFETPGDNYYFGVRRFPYCTDLLKNPLTFKDIDPLQWDGHPGIPRSPLWKGSSPAEVHNVGEVWCATLWEARAKLIAKLGYEKGHELMLQYVTDGMKLAPEDPTFLEGRDGILQAEQVLSGGTNKAVLWAAFAKRGMGLNAVAPPKNYISGVIEDYNPNDVLRIGRLAPQTISGPHGGSFAPSSISYGVTNVGAGSLTWSAKAESPLNISGGSTLAGQGGHATATVTFNAAAVNALPLGAHSRTILFSNHTSGVTQPRTVHLVVTQSLVVAGVPIHTAGLAGSPFAPFTASLKLTNRSIASVSWSATAQAPFELEPSSGTLAGGGNGTVQVSLNTSLAAALPEGSYSNLVTISNLTAGTTKTLAVSVTAAQRSYSEFFPKQSPTDLSNTRLTFVPDGMEYVVCREAATTFAVDTKDGETLPRNSAEMLIPSQEVVLTGGKQVTLFGQATNRLFVNVFGSLSLDSGDHVAGSDYMLARHFLKRRVSGLMAENHTYPPESVVSWKQFPDRFAATFEKMHVLDGPNPGPNTFQIEWFFAGVIRITILQGGGTAGVTGLSRGYESEYLWIEPPFAFFPEDFAGEPTCAELAYGPIKLSVPAIVTEGNGVLSNAGIVTLPEARELDVIVLLTSSDPGELSVPPSVMVPAGATSSVFNVTVPNDTILDGTRNATITASAPLYLAQSKTVQVHDNESTTLHLSLPFVLPEGEEATGFLWTEAPVAENVFVWLATTNSSTLAFPGLLPYAVIPTRGTSTVFKYKAIENLAITGTRYAAISASVSNWVTATHGMLVTDNESTNLSVVGPMFVGENDGGIISNFAQVRISGVLPTNLTVTLNTSGGSLFEYLAFGPVTITAGQTNAWFDMLILDDLQIESLESLHMTASAPGFSSGSWTTWVFDNDAPPEPMDPYPPHLAEDVPLDANLSWAKTEGELLVNGGFEDPSMTGWTRFDSGSGGWISASTSFDPPGPGTANTAEAGARYALSQQFGNGRHEIWQDVTIPAELVGVMLKWSHRLENHAPTWASNQQFRVELRNASNELLSTLFVTNPGEPLSTSWTNRSVSLATWRGQKVRLAFVEIDELGSLNVSLDHVSIIATPPAPTTWLVYLGVNPTPDGTGFLGATTNTSWNLATLPAATTLYWHVKSVRSGATNTGPVWRFTTTDSTNRPPTVALSNPGQNAILTAPNNVILSANSISDDGLVSKVEFWANGSKLGEDTSAPYNYSWANPWLGFHTVWAVAQDSQGARGTSVIHHVSMVPASGIVQTLVPFGSLWNYDDTGANLGAAWRSNSYSSAHWPTGPAQLGYGESDEATEISYGTDPGAKHVTTYFRRAFDAPPDIESWRLRVLRDDGVAVYLNGQEVLRDNLTANADYLTLASSELTLANENTLIGGSLTPAGLSPSLAGPHLVAAEIHQASAGSVDLSFDLELATVVNPKPAVTWVSPAPATVFVVGNEIPLAATAFDPYGSISNVVFFADGIPLATVSVSPYLFTWSNAPSGSHILHAMAWDTQGKSNISASVGIEVVAPPFFVMPPTNQMVHLGEVALFAVVANGSAPLSFQWSRDGTPIPGATTAMLVLSNAQPGDAGLYQVRVSNGVGHVDSPPATLSVKFWPSLEVSYGAERMVLAWSKDETEFVVESTPNLVPPVFWEPVPFGAFLQEGKWTVVYPVEPGPQRFFRLRKTYP